jgi:hypothetical protein
MADTKISGLAPVTDVQDADEYPVARAGSTKKITGANLKAAMPGGVSGARTLTAGAGLAGGGDLSADRSFAVNVDGTTLEIASDTLRVKAGGISASQVAADVATQAELDAHTADTTNAHPASAIGFTPTGTIAASDVQAAIAEVASEAAAGGGIAATIVDAKGDLIAASAADTVTRLAVGSNNQVLVADSAQTLGLKWAAVPGTSAFVPVSEIDAKGDLLVGTANDALDNLAVGSNGQILTVEPSAATGVKWADPVGIPRTLVDAKGDLLVASADDTVARLAVGSNGQVLTADSAQTTGVKWAAAGGGGGVTVLSYVQFTSNVAISASSDAGSDTIVTAAAVTFDGSTLICVEFYAGAVRLPSTSDGQLIISLFDGSSQVGRIAQYAPGVATANSNYPCFVCRYFTPSAATHTYSIRGWVYNGTGSIFAGTGSGSASAPGYIRVTSGG